MSKCTSQFACGQAHDSAGGIGSVLGALAGKAVVAAQETSGAIKEKVMAASLTCIQYVVQVTNDVAMLGVVSIDVNQKRNQKEKYMYYVIAINGITMVI